MGSFAVCLSGLTISEAVVVCRALATERFWARCECEHEVGYECRHCRRMASAPYIESEMIEEYADWLFAWNVK